MNHSKSGSNKGKRAIIYTRVSTDEQAEKGYSLRAQEERLRQYCAFQGIDIAQHFQEDASAKTFKRPEFEKLLKYLQAHKREIDLLLVVKWDRFSRNMEASYPMISQLAEMGVEVQAVEQPVDLLVPENKLMLAFYLAAPDVENERRSLNTIAGMRRAMREGRYVNRPPTGYSPDKDATGKYLIQPNDDAVFVREAFHEMAKGLFTAEEVRRKLIKKGFKCTKNPFAKLLRNPIYKGTIVIPEWRNEEEATVPGLHKPLVSEELFEKVQDVLARRNGSRRGKPVKRNDNLPLRGFLACGSCGGTITGSRTKGNGGYYYYYHCQKGCKERFSANQANEDFTAYLSSLTVAPNVAELYLSVMKDLFQENEGSREQEFSRIDTAIANVQKKLFKADEKFIEGEIPKDSFLRLKKRYDDELSQLQRQKLNLEALETNYEKYVNYGLSLLSDIGKHYEEATLEAKQKLIGSICSKNFIYEKPNYRTTNLNPAIALFCGNSGENRTKEKALNHENSVPVLNGCPTRTRTSTNRTKICGAAITPSGSLKKEPVDPHPKSVPKIRNES